MYVVTVTVEDVCVHWHRIFVGKAVEMDELGQKVCTLLIRECTTCTVLYEAFIKKRLL